MTKYSTKELNEGLLGLTVRRLQSVMEGRWQEHELANHIASPLRKERVEYHYLTHFLIFSFYPAHRMACTNSRWFLHHPLSLVAICDRDHDKTLAEDNLRRKELMWPTGDSPSLMKPRAGTQGKNLRRNQ